MIVIKVFAAGVNRDARIEEALFRFLFPAAQKGTASCSRKAESPPPAGKKGLGKRRLP
ncbi:MAG: hypothetical protein K6T66_02640 [Peptococcaceae bacterium]|nr:hypothetical protein [Peptococcaceae bacterium]